MGIDEVVYMKYCSIASGSNGNCYYIAKADDAVLIDVGINTKHILIRMERLRIDPESIKAIFITHEHTDHIRGLSVFSKRYQIPIYMTEGTYKGSKLNLPDHLVNIIKADDRTSIGALEVIGVPKYHDAKEPCSFYITDGNYNISVLTDVGRACENVNQAVRDADVLLLESNYDEEMLRTGRYSYFLKNRISSGWGHISNDIALQLFLENKSDRLKHLILGHLSGQNNTVDIVRATFESHCEDVRLSIATRDEETKVFELI